MVCMKLTKFCMDFVWIVMVLGMDFCTLVWMLWFVWNLYGNYDFGMDY